MVRPSPLPHHEMPIEPVMPEEEPAEATNSPSAGIVADAAALTGAVRLAVGELLNLFTLETRLAIRSLLTMLLAFLGMIVLLATAWVGSMVALTLLFVRLGFIPVFAVLVVVALNLVMLPFLRRLIQSRLATLGYPVTRATLTNALVHLRGGVLS